MSKHFVTIISSFDKPIYLEYIRLRKIILKKYKIDHIFLHSGNPPPDYQIDEHDYFYDGPLDQTHFKTHMIKKFLKTLKNYESYDYIIRINLSTWINFPLLLSDPLLNEPRNVPLLAGNIMFVPIYDWSLYPEGIVYTFCSGTCMIFSSDVIHELSKVSLDDSRLDTHFDDVILSYLTQKLVPNFNRKQIDSTYWIEDKTTPLDEYKLKNSMIVRIKTGDDCFDLSLWKRLVELN